jgi:hypothetical protein
MTPFGFADRPVKRFLFRGPVSAFCSLMNGAGLGLRFPTLGARTKTRRGWGTRLLWGTQLLSKRGLAAICLLIFLALPAGSQQGVSAGHPSVPQTQQGPPSNGDPFDVSQGPSMQEEKLLRALNADRHKSMVSDANKLLRMAKELNAEIASTNPDSLSLDQLHKMAEIEKLARNVKEKMSTSVRATPTYAPSMERLH